MVDKSSSRLESDLIYNSFERGLDVLTLVTGVDLSNNAQWALVSIPHDKYVAFKAAERRGRYNLSEFGRILESGKGLQPDIITWSKLLHTYGVRADYEEHMLNKLLEIIPRENSDETDFFL